MNIFPAFSAHTASDKSLLWGVVCLFGIVYMGYLVVIWLSPSFWIAHDVHTSVQALPLHAQQTAFDAYIPTLPIEAYVFSESFHATPSVPASAYAYLFLAILVVALTLMLTVSTSLRRFWFFLTQAMFAAVFFMFNVQHIRLFGWLGHGTYVLLVLPFLLGAYYFYALRPQASMLQRFLIFLVLFSLEAVLLHFFSFEADPFSILMHYTYYMPLCLGIVFILLVGQEPIYFIAWVSTSGRTQNGWRFVSASAIYLLLLGLLVMKNMGFIAWDIYYIDAFVLLGFSTLVGIWGMKAREEYYSYLSPFYPYAFLYYLALAIITLSTATYLKIQGNDPALEVFEDTIVFGHLAFGAGFFLHIIYNFLTPLYENMRVWKIAYKEHNLPYLTSRLAGLMLLLAVYFGTGYTAYYQAIAGFFNRLSDLYHSKEAFALSGYYSRIGSVYGFQNHHSNYRLGQLHSKQEAHGEAAVYYHLATQKNPTPQAFLNYGNTYESLSLPIQARSLWKKGLERFEHHPLLENNLGLSYIHANKPDSALSLLQQNTPSARTNRAYLHALQPMLPVKDQAPAEDAPSPFSLFSLFERANTWVWAMRRDTILPLLDVDTIAPLSDYASYAYAYDFFLMSMLRGDSTVTAQIETYLQAHTTHPYARGIRYLLAYAYFKEGHPGQAIRLMEQWPALSPSQQGYDLYFMGTCAFAARAYENAAAFFLRAYARGYAQALEAYLQTCYRLVGRGIFERQRIAFEEIESPRLQSWLQARAQWKAFPLDSLLAQDEKQRVHAVLLGMGDYEQPVLETLIASLPSPLQQRLWVALGHFFLERDDPAQAHEALLRAEALGKDRHSASLRAEHAFSSRAVQDLPAYAHVVDDKSYALWFVHAQAHDAVSMRLLARQHPFKVGLVLKSAEWLQTQGYALEAYEVLREAIADNTRAPRLYQAYSLQCLRMGLDNYAQEALEDLRDMLSETAFAAFMQHYTRVQTEQETLLDW